MHRAFANGLRDINPIGFWTKFAVKADTARASLYRRTPDIVPAFRYLQTVSRGMWGGGSIVDLTGDDSDVDTDSPPVVPIYTACDDTMAAALRQRKYHAEFLQPCLRYIEELYSHLSLLEKAAPATSLDR